jgi:hypothetical protein
LTKSGTATVHKYVQKIEISKNGKERLLTRRFRSKVISEETWAKAHQDASKIIGDLNKRDYFLLATALYWGEGTKQELNLINGDPRMIKIFLESLLSMGVQKHEIKISIRYYSTQNKELLTKFWITYLKLSDSNIAGFEKVASSGENKLEYGMCRIRVVKSSCYHKLLLSAIKIISPGSSVDRTEAS